MSGFKGLGDSFEKGSAGTDKKSPESKGLNTVRQSLSIVRAIDKLKAQGVKITKKADLDYLLALRVLERANVDPYEVFENEEYQEKEEAANTGNDVKRNPVDHPKEFQAAMEYSRKIVGEAEELLKQGQTLSDKKLTEYDLCRKFLEKYT
ncbi:MAG: hypothetical protein GY940_06725 [bacterium]|nr:hypothetical protein [bacterium]